MALALGDFTVAGGGSSGGGGFVVWIKDKEMNQPLSASKLFERDISEQRISILRGKIDLCFNDIIRLEAVRNYTRFVLKDGRKLLTSKTISFYEALLFENFVRVHKSHLLNRLYITEKSKTHILMSDGTEVEVSRRKWRIAEHIFN